MKCDQCEKPLRKRDLEIEFSTGKTLAIAATCPRCGARYEYTGVGFVLTQDGTKQTT